MFCCIVRQVDEIKWNQVGNRTVLDRSGEIKL